MGDSEVSQRRLPVIGQQNVRRLDVAMQDFPTVCGFQRTGYLHTDVQNLLDGQSAKSANPRFQRTPLVILHHQVGAAALGLADLQHADNVGVPCEPTHRALLAQKPFSVLLHLRGEDLHGHHAIKRRLATAKDDAESTPADLIGISESGRTQLRDDGRAHVSLR